MELSVYSVVSYRDTAVAVVLVGHSGCYWSSLEAAQLPRAQEVLLDVVFEQLSQRSSIRELRRLRDRLGAGPTQFSEPLPVTFDREPGALLDNLAKRFLAPAPSEAAG